MSSIIKDLKLAEQVMMKDSLSEAERLKEGLRVIRSIISSTAAAEREPVSEIVERLEVEASAMHLAVSGVQVGDTFHARNWSDKPHRVLYDAVGLIREATSTLTSLSTRNAELEAENARLRNELRIANEKSIYEKDRTDVAEERLAEAMKALEFYADPKNWTDTPSWDGDPECFTEKAIPVRMQEGAQVCDCGDTARRVREGGKVDG